MAFNMGAVTIAPVTASEVADATTADQAFISRFQKGKPADPTQNMDPDDADEWKEMNQEHGDNFKAAASSSELREMQELLQKHGYNPKDAQKLQKEGMGTYELEHRLKTTKPGGMGSLEYTHGLKKQASDEVVGYGRGYRRNYPRDPSWINAKYPGTAIDGTPFAKGDRILWFPNTKTIMVGPKAEKEWQEFQRNKEDDNKYKAFQRADFLHNH